MRRLKIKDVPTGIFILAAISFIKGIWALLGMLIAAIALLCVFLIGGFQAVELPEHLEPVAIITFFLILIIGIAFSGLFILCGSWLVTLQLRGWILATIGVSIYLLLELVKIYQGVSSGPIDAIIYIIILLYLNKKSTRRAFGL
ncbi:MAG: hypothetical protein JW986_09510 [Methanotrichaceae archaeon]|nr:hypothetical protein [Methanotrichaceae archaeon]